MCGTMYPQVGVNMMSTLFSHVICDTDSRFLLKCGAAVIDGAFSMHPDFVWKRYGAVVFALLLVPSGSIMAACWPFFCVSCFV